MAKPQDRHAAQVVARLLVLGAAAGLCLTAPSCRGADAAALEVAIKATDLYKFVPFISWPPSAFAGDAAPFTICTGATDAVGDILAEAIAHQSVGNRPIAVRRLAAGEAARGCQILYVPGPDAVSGTALAQAQGMPVLTVTDGASGAAPKGIINFVFQDNRVRFEINDRLAGEAGLAISSKLMRLAVSEGPKS